MVKQNINCWEYFKCGCEPGGKNNTTIGICSAASEGKYNEINNGKNGGRFCWLVEKTLCNGTVHDSFFDKIEECFECEFYLMLQKQENKHLTVVQNELS
jgi:hypothetical protein